eukprot:7917034-Pyramimonas_sp.AAC.1
MCGTPRTSRPPSGTPSTRTSPTQNGKGGKGKSQKGNKGKGTAKSKRGATATPKPAAKKAKTPQAIKREAIAEAVDSTNWYNSVIRRAETVLGHLASNHADWSLFKDSVDHKAIQTQLEACKQAPLQNEFVSMYLFDPDDLEGQYEDESSYMRDLGQVSSILNPAADALDAAVKVITSMKAAREQHASR